MAAITTCPDSWVLERLALGDMSPLEVEQLAVHCERCEKCIQVLQQPRGADTLVAAMSAQGTVVEPSVNPAVAALVARLKSLGWLTSVARDQATMPPSSVNTPLSEPPHPTADNPSPNLDFLAPPQAPDEIGRLGSFRVLKVLGQGGMGVVLQAEDTRLGRLCALKVMLSEVARRPEMKERFLREARAAAQIEHDHIVPIFQVDEDRGVPFIAMPFLKGSTLEEWIQIKQKTGAPITVSNILKLAREMAKGLSAAHERSLIHRDIKPANIWLDSTVGGRVKILDFGLARLSNSTGKEQNLTQSGMIMGTPAYMAPEQAQGKKDLIDGRTDLFSLGCILYRLSTGSQPFHGDDMISTLVAVAMENPAPPSEVNRQIPQAVSDLVMQLLEKKPEDRPASAKEVVKIVQQMEKDLAAGILKPASETAAMTKPEAEPAVTKPAPVSELPAVTAEMLQSFTPKRRKRPKTKKRWNNPVLLIGGGVFGIAALVVAGIILFWETPKGTVRVEILDPEIRAAIDQENFKIHGPMQEISIRPGQHGLRIKRGDFEFETDKFVLKKNEVVTLKVELLPGKVQVVTAEGKIIGEKVLSRPGATSPAVAKGPAAAPPVNAPGIPATGYVLRTSGTGQQLDISNVSLKTQNTWTVEAWVTPREPLPRADEAALVLMVDPVWISLKGQQKWALGGPVSRPVETIIATGKAEAGKPVHLAMSRGPQGVSFFVNGVREGEPFPIAFGAGQSGLRFFPVGRPEVRDVGFLGDIHEARVSSGERYSGNFTPKPRFENDADTLALYHFDEGQGDTFKDASGHGHDGKLFGAKWVKATRPDTTFALQFQGADRVIIPPSQKMNLADDNTFELWVKLFELPSSKGNPVALLEHSKLHNDHDLVVAIDNRFQFFALKGETVKSTTVVESGRWYHVAATYRANNKIELFVNGTSEASLAISKKLAQNDNPLVISGSAVFLNHNGINGIVQGVRISKGARYTQSFVPQSRFEADANTLALYHCDDGQGDILRDSSGHGIHGTIVGAKWVKADETPVAPLDDGFVSLFNGKDLTGWEKFGNGNWTADNGVLRADGSGIGWLGTQRNYSEFEMELEYRLPAKGNSGIFVHAWPEGHASGRDFLEVQLIDETVNTYGKDHDTCAIVKVLAPNPSVKTIPDTWHKVGIKSQGRRFQVFFEGRQVIDANLDEVGKGHAGLAKTTGRIGLQCYNTKAEFRNIRLREPGGTGADKVDAAPGSALVESPRSNPVSTPNPVTKGAVPERTQRLAIPNGPGKDNWKIEGNELVKTSQDDSVIILGATQWRDYDFTADVMTTSTTDQGMGLVFRANDNDHYWHAVNRGGTRTPRWLNKQATLLAAANEPADRLVLNRWYRLSVQVRGDRFTTFVDGRKVTSVQDSSIPSGRVGIRAIGAAGRIKNIKVADPQGKLLWEGLPALGAELTPPK
jgi:serine/threonine protein kinase